MKSSENSIEKLQRQLCQKENLPSYAFRRNMGSYELVSYVNNITACYISNHLEPIPILIGRVLDYIENNEIKGADNYCSLVLEYFQILEKYLKENAVSLSGIDIGHARYNGTKKT